VVDISAAIVKAGGVSVVVSSGGARVHDITRGGGVHITLPVHSKNPFTIAANIGRLRKIIKEYDIDLVHACSRAPAWSAERAIKGTRARYITSCHAAHKISGSLKRFYNASITRGEKVIAVSRFLAGYLQSNYGVPLDKIRVIHRGVALERFHPHSVSPERLIDLSQQLRIPEGMHVVMLPGRLTRIKGHMSLIDALALLNRRDVFCLFVGSDIGNEGYRRELEAYIEGKNLGGNVRIVNNCKDIPAAYMISAVVCCPSLVPEGFGRVQVEAQAMGRPLITTDHGGVRETVVRGETGWLVNPGDAGALAEALAEAIDMDAAVRAKLATAAMSNVAQNFSNEIMCQKTLDVYAEVLNAAATAASAQASAATSEPEAQPVRKAG